MSEEVDYAGNSGCIEANQPCGEGLPGTWGCDKCLDENGKCRCCEGLQMWGCAAAQEPRCVTKEYLESKQAEEKNPY